MRKKKLLALLLTLAMLVSMLPMAVLPAAAEPAAPEEVTASTWQALRAYLVDPDVSEIEITLGADIAAYSTSPDAMLVVPAGKKVTLDLNGCDIYAAYEENPLSAGITVAGSLTLMDSLATEKEEETGINGAKVGVAVAEGGSFTMESGYVCRNAVGVAVAAGGTFTMKSGYVCDNDAVGVTVSGGSFAMNSGYVCNNDVVGVAVGGGSFTMCGGVVGAVDSGYCLFGVMVGPDVQTIAEQAAQYDKEPAVLLLSLLSEQDDRPGGKFTMSDDAAILGNALVGVYVAGSSENYNAAFDMEGGTICDIPYGGDADDLDNPYVKIGVFALDANVTMTGGVISGGYNSTNGYTPLLDSYMDLPMVEIGAVISNGTLSMSNGAKITGHNVLGVAGGYALDEILKLYDTSSDTVTYHPVERRGTTITMNNAAIENSGILGALLYGYDYRVGTDVKACLTMNNAAITTGEGAALIVPLGRSPILLRPQLGLAAVGANVTMQGNSLIGANELTPFVGTYKVGSDAVPDVTLQLGAVMCDGKLDLSGGAKISGNNIGGVLMGYLDDIVDRLPSRFRRSLQMLKLGNKHDNIINLSGGAIKDNGLFGAITVGAKDEKKGNLFAEVNMKKGGSVSGNAVVGLAGVKTYYVMQDTDTEVSDNLLGVLAALHSDVTVGTGAKITGNTIGAAAVAASKIMLNGGKVVNNKKAFTVSGPGDSIDQLLALVGDYKSLIPSAYRTIPDTVLTVLRLVLNDQISENTVSVVTDAINEFAGSDYMTADDVMWVINLLNYGLENSQQIGIVVETLTSALDVRSGEISGNAHGVSVLTVNSNLLEDMKDYFALYRDNAGVTLDGSGFALKGNDKSDVDLTSISVESLEQKIPPEAPILTVKALPANSAIRTGVYQLLVKQAADVEIEPAEDSTMLQAILCAIAEALHNVRVTVDPLPDVPFTEGLRGKGTADSFTSAIDGYNVTLNGDGEAMLSKPYTPSGVGGGKTYKITVAATENGTATASKSTAAEGEKITVTARPADGFELDSISVKGEKAGTVEVKDGAFTMPADDVTVTVKFKKADAKQTFSDVKPGDWFYEGVEYVAEKGWMQGPGGGVFQPNETTTRAMVAQVLWNMAGKPVVNAAIPFADVAEGAWYADSVRWAAEKGVVTGWTDESGKQVFDPEGKVTREQFAAMLYRYAKTLGKGFQGLWSFQLDFPDALDVSPWATEAMSWMVMQGVINGMDGKLNPQGYSTRAQIAAMLQRFDTLG